MEREFGRWVTERNILRFRKLMQTETDAPKRKVLEELLASEKEKLSLQTQQCASAKGP